MEAQTFGRYQIKSILGRGGMATVYLAHDPRFQRNVALKVMSEAFLNDPTFRGRFEREARTIATLEHASIVPVYDYGEDQNQPYLVMRYMPGGSLAERIIQGPISLPDALPIIKPIAAALDHAHHQGVIHRDLKPGNILFDEYDNAFLSDFGIVKIAETTASLTGSGIIGTPAYMSPEQVHGEKAIDGRSDIYTLGVILFEMLTGRKPFRAETPVKLMMAHVLTPIPSILAAKPELPSGCESLIQKSLAKEPDARFASGRELTAALTLTVTGTFPMPELPSPPSSPSVSLVSPDDATETIGGGTAVSEPALDATAVTPTPEPDQSLPPKKWSSGWRWLIGGLVGLLLVSALWFAALNLPEEPTATLTPTTASSLAAAEEVIQPTATLTPTRSATPTPTPSPSATPTAVPPTPTLESRLIGNSVAGTPIYATRFGEGEKAVVFVGGLHAGFAPGSVLLAQESITYFGQHPELIPADVTLYIIPSINPDSPLDPGNLPGRLNANGVDLNRNWGCRWQQDASVLGQFIPGVGGVAPFSEPEVEHLSEFIISQQTVAVVFWEARSTGGLVSPGKCEETSGVSGPLAQVYGEAAGYAVADFERLTSQQVNGDGANWLDQQEIPAVAVLMPDYEEIEWENNLAGMLAVLQSVTEE